MDDKRHINSVGRRHFLAGIGVGVGLAGATAAVARRAQAPPPRARDPEPILYRRTAHIERYYKTLYW